jgi:hypothetical protein
MKPIKKLRNIDLPSGFKKMSVSQADAITKFNAMSHHLPEEDAGDQLLGVAGEMDTSEEINYGLNDEGTFKDILEQQDNDN